MNARGCLGFVSQAAL